MTAPQRPDYDLFHPPPDPPTGPSTDVGKFGPSERRRYDEWKATREGWRAWRYMEATALDLAGRGEKRISAKYLAEQARRALEPHVEVNNNWTAFIGDDLVSRHPHLEKLIERRKRRKVNNAA